MSVSTIKRVSRFLALLAVALVGAVFYLNSRSERKTLESSLSAEVPVRVAQVKRTTLPLTLRFTGELAAITKADVVSRLAGKVTEVRFKVGDLVPAGALVATIHASDLDQRIGGFIASVSAAKQDQREREAELAIAEKRVAENRDLFARDLIARRDVEQSEMSAETVRAQAGLARAHLAQREAMLGQVRALQDLTRLTAPTSGQVGIVWIKPGAAVAEGGTILSIESLSPLKLVVKFNGGRLLRRGMRSEISTSALPGIVLRGQVVRLETEKNSEGKNAAEIHIDNPKRLLRPGMVAEVSIDLEAEGEVFLVPRSAIVSEKDRSYLYKLSGGRAARQEVVLGTLSGEEIAVAQGLEAGDTVIVDLKMIEPGTRVRAVQTQLNPAEKKR